MIRAAFDAPDEAEAAMVGQNLIMALEDVLDEETDEAKITELVTFENAVELAELSNRLKQVRNNLVTLKRKDAVLLAQELDEFAHGIDFHLNPEDVGPQYDKTHFWEVCAEIWEQSKSPTH